RCWACAAPSSWSAPATPRADGPAAMARRAALAALALLLLVGCAKPMRDYLYVLMPDKEGKTGVLAVESGGQQAVLDRPYASARVAEPGRVQPGTVSEQEARQAFGAALGAQ